MIEIREIRRQDHKRAQQFAIQGMHFDWYMDSKVSLSLYAKYFWDMEWSRATRAYGAYADGTFVGVLLADMRGEPKRHRSSWRRAYVRFFDWVQHLIAGAGVSAYDTANQAMYQAFCQDHTPDGEIVFLAADPNSTVKGIGTALLAALERDESGKLVYLYTDDACTYPFYEHRGFTRAAERRIVLELGKKRVPLTCLFYAKVLGDSAGS